MNEEDGQRRPRETVRTFEERFWLAKDLASEARKFKDRVAFAYDAIEEGLTLVGDWKFIKEIRAEMDTLDPEDDDAANWIDAGRFYVDWEELHAMRIYNDLTVIVARVQAEAIRRRVLEGMRRTPEDLEKELELEALRRELERVKHGEG